MWHINNEFLILHFTQMLTALPEYKYLAYQFSSKAVNLASTLLVIKTLNIQTAALTVAEVNKLVFLPVPH
jgi:hypothetical protein